MISFETEKPKGSIWTTVFASNAASLADAATDMPELRRERDKIISKTIAYKTNQRKFICSYYYIRSLASKKV